MFEASNYIGNELELFALANNWKGYWMKKIQPFLGESVLEVGAGIGSNTRLFLDQNQGVTSWVCLEPDINLANKIPKEIPNHYLPKLQIYADYLRCFKSQEKFDSILYIDVIEHVENDSSEIQLAKNFLKPDGYLIILVPALNYLFSDFDRAIGHFRRYNKNEIEKVVGENLETIKLEYLDSVGVLASLLNKFILKQKYPSEKQIVFWDSTIIPISELVDPGIGRVIGKSLLGIWKLKRDV
ncbi:bifunctional 2-polyprenyl-6-hydroxyphenol methylase/3-demethylubiquinol 3-O-methyltransferase UbiG [Mangrovimonas sp. DI 80]|uniref:class I SAM-dependent methyltransferase n=1 Tax=Mangrovimonas sp. DI 80 TaxID=1779330 RepID=UPI000978B050|nr:methyltransferase domain-containing protein [Mangrovimonas sp. DI 80]OMP31167.1 hypothetical protein BKM32_08890 [Mangrovimonas sp. DI 80]